MWLPSSPCLHPSSPSVGVVLTDMIRISDMPPSQSNKYRTSMPPGVLSSVVVSPHKMLISLIHFNSIDGWMDGWMDRWIDPLILVDVKNIMVSFLPSFR
jgi:hypothetical protein